MICPVCGNDLIARYLELPTSNRWDEMEVDACVGGCGGLWFDRFELDKVDEPDEVGRDALFDVERDPNVEVNHDADRDCPKCDDIVMMKKFFSVSRNVEIDECGGCAGIWLDAGELENLRQLYDSEEEREEAFDEHFEKQLAPQLAKLETENQKASGIRKVLRFFSPSHWIPGDQTGAAY